MTLSVRCRPDSRSVRRIAHITSIIGCISLAGCSATYDGFSDEQRLVRVSTDLADMYAEQEPVRGAIDLHEAIARGLKYNLDKRLKLMEIALADSRLRVARADLLPELVATAGYRARDKFRGSSSRSLITGLQSLEVSTSEDKRVESADLALVWNILDFGLTYLRTKQEQDQVVIAHEQRMKVVQNMILDIRDAYWRATAAQRMLPEVGRLSARIRRQLRVSRRSIRSGDGEPETELETQRVLLEQLRDLEDVKRKLSLARSELAALINLPPGTHFHVKLPRRFAGRVPKLKADTTTLEHVALFNRPELRQEDHRKRITQTDVKAAYVRMLPGVEIRLGRNYDSNSFLFDSSWSNLGVLLTKNLMEIATAPARIEAAEADVAVADARREALSMAVLAQVHISLQRYALAKSAYRLAANLSHVNNRISRITRSGGTADGRSSVEVLQAEARRVVSRLKYLAAYADVQNAHGRIVNSVGLNRFPADVETEDVATLAHYVRAHLDQIDHVNYSAAPLGNDKHAALK